MEFSLSFLSFSVASLLSCGRPADVSRGESSGRSGIRVGHASSWVHLHPKEGVKGEQESAEKPAIEPFKHFAIVVVKLDFPEEDDEDEDEADASNGEVHFEAFQLSDQCIKLYVDGWFDEEWEVRKKESAEARRKGKGPAGKEEFKEEDDDPKVSHMRKDVIVERKDTKVVDNDFFLMPVKIEDHEVWRVEPLYRLRWIGRIEPCNALVHPC